MHDSARAQSSPQQNQPGEIPTRTRCNRANSNTTQHPYEPNGARFLTRLKRSRVFVRGRVGSEARTSPEMAGARRAAISRRGGGAGIPRRRADPAGEAAAWRARNPRRSELRAREEEGTHTNLREKRRRPQRESREQKKVGDDLAH